MAAALRAERAAADITIDELAAQSGIAPRTLKRRLTVQRAFLVSELEPLAAVFKLTSSELVAKAEDLHRRYGGAIPESVSVQETAAQMVRDARETVREPLPDDAEKAAESPKIQSARRRGMGRP